MENTVLNLLARKKGSTFAGITYTSKEANETSRYTLLLNADYKGIISKSLKMLSEQFPAIADLVGNSLDTKSLNSVLNTTEEKVVGELLTSFNKSLKSLEDNTKNDSYTKKDTYVPTEVKGIKEHLIDGSLELSGLVINKTVLKEGEHKPKNSSEKTILKNKIRNTLPIGKFRTFSLEASNFHSLRIGNSSVEVK